jgi:hypothetical protein
LAVDFSGTWSADLSRSTFYALRPAGLQLTIHHCDPELGKEILAKKTDGSQERGSFHHRTTGESHENLLNGRLVRSVAKWIGEELVIETWMELGSREMYFCDCWSLSSDGQTLIMEHRNDALSGERVVLARAV